MKHIAIRRLYSYFEIDSEAIQNGSDDEMLLALDKELTALLNKYGLKEITHDTRFIPMQKMSAQQCEQCNNLMINRDRNPARFNREDLWADLDTDYNGIIWDGGTHDGKSLCMECLPIEHRWGYSSYPPSM